MHHPCVKAVSRLQAVAEGQPVHRDDARPTIVIEIIGRRMSEFDGKKLGIHTGANNTGIGC